MDPSKQLGKIREQVDRENISRRRYPLKWGQLTQKDVNCFYNQNYVNDHIIQSNSNDLDPNQYTGSGESYFLSKDMYNSLVRKCRCGRLKKGIHLTKCLQQIKNIYISDDEDDKNDKDIDEHEIEKSDKKLLPAMKELKVPATSNGMIGWVPNRLQQFDKTTKYISPKYSMPGYKIDDHPYNYIFIG